MKQMKKEQENNEITVISIMLGRVPRPNITRSLSFVSVSLSVSHSNFFNFFLSLFGFVFNISFIG